MLRIIKHACAFVCVLYVVASLMPFVPGFLGLSSLATTLMVYISQWLALMFVVRLVCLVDSWSFRFGLCWRLVHVSRWALGVARWLRPGPCTTPLVPEGTGIGTELSRQVGQMCLWVPRCGPHMGGML